MKFMNKVIKNNHIYTLQKVNIKKKKKGLLHFLENSLKKKKKNFDIH